LPALFTGCTGVYMQTIDLFIENYLYNMRVSTDKQSWRLSVYFTPYSRTVFSGVAAYVRHPNVYVFALKSEVLGIGFSYLFAVNIAVNPFKRLKGGQAVGHVYIAKIAGMPNLVAIFKMFENGIVQKAVGIGKETYTSHFFIFELRMTILDLSLILMDSIEQLKYNKKFF
jgi:hypothetical protein